MVAKIRGCVTFGFSWCRIWIGVIDEMLLLTRFNVHTALATVSPHSSRGTCFACNRHQHASTTVRLAFADTILLRRVWGGRLKVDSFAGEPILTWVACELSAIVGSKSVNQVAFSTADHACVVLEGLRYLRYLLQKVDAAPSAVVVGKEHEESWSTWCYYVLGTTYVRVNQLSNFIGPCPTDWKRRSLHLSAHTSQAWLRCCAVI